MFMHSFEIQMSFQVMKHYDISQFLVLGFLVLFPQPPHPDPWAVRLACKDSFLTPIVSTTSEGFVYEIE